MDLLLVQDIQPCLGVVRLKYSIPVADQIDLHQVGNLFLVINYQNADL